MSRWPMVPLGEVLRHRKEFVEIDDFQTYKRCRVQLHAQGVVLRDCVVGAQIKTKKQQVCRAGELLVAEIDAKVGGYGIVPDDLAGAIVSSHYFLFTIDETRLDRSFLGFYIKTGGFFDQVAAQGSTNYAAIRPSAVLNYRIPLPNPSEQRRIALKMRDVAGRLAEASHQRILADREIVALRTAAISQVVVALGLTGTLKDVLTSRPRNGWSIKCDGADGGVAVLGLGAITGYRYRPDQAKRTSGPTDPNAHYWLHRGDLLISRSNTPELVGHAAIYDGTPSPCIYPDLMMRLPVDPDKCEPKFIHYVLQSRAARDFIKIHAKGTSPTMKKISQGIVEAIPFPSDCKRELQLEVVRHLDCVTDGVTRAQIDQRRCLSEFNALMPGVLDRAFRGEL